MIKTMYNKNKNLRSMKLWLFILLLCSFSYKESVASHASGADLTYTSLGGGQYLVTFTFYRDCFGIDPPNSQQLTVSSSTCNFTQNYTMDTVPDAFPGIGVEITPNCSTTVSTCAGGTATGIQQATYSVIVTLPAQCADWQFRTSVSARNAAITTIQNPDGDNLYVEAYLSNLNGENSSPTFTNPPIAFECIGQDNYFNQGVIDAEGDSLVYSFIAPRTNPNVPLTYNPGYSVANPLTSVPPVYINPVTGDIFMHPTQPEVVAMAVLVEEYRNGVIIGTVMRDIQLYMVNCSNTLPSATGIDTSNTYATSTCVGGPLCFNILTNDPDPAQVLTMTWNSGIPGATFTTSGSPHPVGQFCWTPQQSDARTQPYNFTVTVRDNACPSNGTQTYSYQIYVSNMSVQLTSTPSVACFGSHNGSAMATATGNPPLTYSWTFPTGNIISGPTSVSHLQAGNYVLNVTDANNCLGVSNFTITEPPALNVNVTGVNSGCGGSSSGGSATANVTGGTSPYTYQWNTTPVQTTQTATNLSTNTYLVQVKDSNNCTEVGSVQITSVVPVTFSISSTPATCVANDGSVTVSRQGGVGPFSYVWTPDIPQNTTTSSLNNLITGSYSVIATDLGTGCSASLNALVGNNSGITATISAQSDASCDNVDDGSATVLATGGQLPYSYLWPNGDTLPTTNRLGAGTHLVRVEDYSGCFAYASVTIGFDNASPVINFGPDTAACISAGAVILDAGTGFTSYSWSDGSFGQTLSVSPPGGTISCLVSNAFGCENSDVIEVTFLNCLSPNGSSRIRNSTLNIYPNPVNTEVNIHIGNIHDTEVKLALYDILGNTVYNYSERAQYGFNGKIDLHALSQGIYYLKVEYNDEISTSRIVKQ